MSYDSNRNKLLCLIGAACLFWGMVILEFCILAASIFFSQALAAVAATISGAFFYTVFQNTLKKIKETINDG